MMLNSKVYDILKWICLIALPAISVFINTIFPVWNIPYAEPITITINAVALLVGAMIGVSTIAYNKGDKLDG